MLIDDSSATKERPGATSPKSRIRSFFHEPLVQFLILGGLLFLFFEWSGAGSGAGSTRIVITRGQIDHLAVGFARTWLRPPNETELKGLIDEYVKEEIATREALSMGLDRDDTIIRRRLRQKLEFLSEEATQASRPTDAELSAWVAKHPESFRAEPKLAFHQVFFSPRQRGAAARSDAEKVLVQLRAGGAPAATDRLGDASMLPSEQKLAPLYETTRSFGNDFAQELLKLEPGKWSGPLESPYGLHLVRLDEKVAASQPKLSEVRPLVEREWLSERRKTDLQSLYDKLLKKYSVRIDQPEPAK